jgi:hypothetical protein
LAPFYKVEGDMPKAVAVHVSLRDGSGKEVVVAQDEVGKLPWQGKLPLTAVPEGDRQLVGEIVIGKDHIRLNPQTVSAVSAPVKHLKDLEDGLGQIKAKPNTTQRATLASHLAILKSLFAKETPETNYPAARLLAESEAALKVVGNGGDYFGKARPGEFWITLADEHGTLPVRIMAPEAVATGKPLPLVIALHGPGHQHHAADWRSLCGSRCFERRRKDRQAEFMEADGVPYHRGRPGFRAGRFAAVEPGPASG